MLRIAWARHVHEDRQSEMPWARIRNPPWLLDLISRTVMPKRKTTVTPPSHGRKAKT